MIFQHLYYPRIRPAVRREVTNCDTCQCTKQSNKKYVKLPAKLDEGIKWNIICVYLIGPYVIRIKGKKEKLHLNAATMIYPVTRCFEIGNMMDR